MNRPLFIFLFFAIMKNWENIEADENLILTKHFTPGRAGAINKIVLHHNAGNLTIRGCYNVWQDREASAHYQVQSDGRIGQLVWDKDTAWHAGNFDANSTSIGIEHADCQARPWKISDACLENGAHLVAALCKYYKLGRPTWMKNVFPHSYFSSTECPASIAGSQNAAYMKRAQEWYDAMMKGSSAPAASKPSKPARPAKKNINTIAQEVINGAWGNGDDRRRRLEAAGYNYAEVQNAVNAKLGGGSNTPTHRTGPSLDDVARAVIRGDFGNGEERRRRLVAAGYNYNAVQARVNQLL